MSINDLDPDALRRCQAGDPAALGMLYDCYRQPVYYLARRMVGPREAEDVCHEIFIAIFRGLRRFRGQSKFSTWVLAVGTRVCLMHLRKRRSRVAQAEPLEAADVELADTLSPDVEVATRNFWERLSAAIDELPDRQRAALTLRSFEDMSYEQIARALHLGVEQVRAILFRARRSLIARLKEEHVAS